MTPTQIQGAIDAAREKLRPVSLGIRRDPLAGSDYRIGSRLLDDAEYFLQERQRDLAWRHLNAAVPYINAATGSTTA